MKVKEESTDICVALCPSNKKNKTNKNTINIKERVKPIKKRTKILSIKCVREQNFN